MKRSPKEREHVCYNLTVMVPPKRNRSDEALRRIAMKIAKHAVRNYRLYTPRRYVVYENIFKSCVYAEAIRELRRAC